VISEVVMPQMGADMEEGTIVRWMKREGDAVERGEIIAEIETDKANVEIEAFESGVFRKVIAGEGDTVPVGAVIAVIAAPDDDISQYEGAAVAAAPAESKAEPPPSPAPPAPAPAAPAPAAEAPAETATPPSPARTNGRVRASPVARKLAEESGVDLSRVRGTGPDGRIVRRDVEAALAQQAAPRPSAPPVQAAPVETVAMSKIRQTIARRMSQSKREAPHYYITADIDMTQAERMRRDLNDDLGDAAHVTVNDLLVKGAALALARHPMFNTWLVDGEVQRHAAINVCIGIALEEGLIAPAVLDCRDKPLAQIARESRSLVERAKSGALKPEEYTGGTFTISNLGAYGVETLVAIIQPPQTAILGVGAMQATPVVRDGAVSVAQTMKVALSADHRVTDGAEGAVFLAEVRRLLEHPVALVL
jgi:pyruvate dehydrogenase E2 component (dihydrolipoamide acetyltransferase)